MRKRANKYTDRNGELYKYTEINAGGGINIRKGTENCTGIRR